MRHLLKSLVLLLLGISDATAISKAQLSTLRPPTQALLTPLSRRRHRSRITAAFVLPLKIRGGAAVVTRPGVVAPPSPSFQIKSAPILYALSALLSTYLLLSNRSALAKLFDKAYLQTRVLEILQNAKKQGNVGIFTYMLGMALWESVGISTIPVETAAGMVFGWSAILASTMGKLMGASLAFAMGRGFLSNAVQDTFGENETLLLVQHAVKEHPIRTAFLMKYSCFPETIKNYGSSLFTEIHYWMFALATVVHGTPFTCVWTWLGMDSAKRLLETLPVDQALQVTLGVTMFIGVVITPMVMAWWIRDMKRMLSMHHASMTAEAHGTSPTRII